MEKINFENGTLVSPAKVTIDGTDYIVTPAERTGNTPISAHVLNQLQNKIEKSTVAVSSTEPSTNEKVWIKKGKNLFDKSKIMSGYVMSDGAIRSDGEHNEATSDFIPIIAEEAYTASIRNYTSSDGDVTWLGISLYDANKGFTARYAELGVESLNVTNQQTSGAFYMRLSYRYNDNNIKCQVEQGTEVTEFEQYIDKEILVKNDNGIFEKFVNVSDLEKQDTGWIDMSAYVNTDYFAVRPGDSSLHADERPMVRKIGNIVYWKGEIYCKNVPDTKQHIIAITGIPQMFIPDYQYSTSGCTYMDNSNYNMFIENSNIVISHANMTVTPATMGYQLSNLSGYIVD